MIEPLLQTVLTLGAEVPTGWLAWLLRGAMAALALAMLMTVMRLVRGPALPDRVVALDLMATIIVGLVAVYAMASGQPVLLHVAIGMALMMFVGTVAFALYLEKGAGR